MAPVFTSIGSLFGWAFKSLGAAWALAFAFAVLLGYATFLQIGTARAASKDDVAAVVKRVLENEIQDAATHATVDAKLELILVELKELRADLRDR